MATAETFFETIVTYNNRPLLSGALSCYSIYIKDYNDGGDRNLDWIHSL